MTPSSTRIRFERRAAALKVLQHVLDNLLKLPTDCDIRSLVKEHNIKSILGLMNLCLWNDWGRDLDITTSVSRPIQEDQRMLLIELVLFQRFCNGQSSDGYFNAWEDTTEQQFIDFVDRHCVYPPETLPPPVRTPRTLDNFPMPSTSINSKPSINGTPEDNQVTPRHQEPTPDNLESCPPSLVSPEPQTLPVLMRDISPINSQSLESEDNVEPTDDIFEAPTSDEHLPPMTCETAKAIFESHSPQGNQGSDFQLVVKSLPLSQFTTEHGKSSAISTTKLDSASEFLKFRHGPDNPPDQENSTLISQSLSEHSFKIEQNSISYSESVPKIPMNSSQLESNLDYQIDDQNGESSCPEDQSILWENESESSLSIIDFSLSYDELELPPSIWSDNSVYSEESDSDFDFGQHSAKDVLLPCLSEGRGNQLASACDWQSHQGKVADPSPVDNQGKVAVSVFQQAWNYQLWDPRIGSQDQVSSVVWRRRRGFGTTSTTPESSRSCRAPHGGVSRRCSRWRPSWG